MHDLSHEPLIGIRMGLVESRVSLPELLARLSAREPVECTGLRPHQADPWHVFLVQIAASVMARQPAEAPAPDDVRFWREGLLELAQGCTTAWELLVEDVTKPAFMQHPLTSGEELSKFKHKASTPDELDVLVTAKDHDVKLARMDRTDPEAWLFALLVYQTCSGYLGSGNYGTVRMNSGDGSRSIVSLVSDPSPGVRFAEELAAVRRLRSGLRSKGLPFADRGVVLTWLTRWSRRSEQWLIGQLEPWFVESVRPLRLMAREDAIQAFSATSDARQVGPKVLDSGDVGDPWLPVEVNGNKKARAALEVKASGWTPELLCRLLFQEGIEVTALQRPRKEMTGTSWLMCSVLVRGQGTTNGFHRVAVPVPARARAWLAQPDDRERMARVATELLSDAKEIEVTLRKAMQVLARGGPERSSPKDEALKSTKKKDDTLQRWCRAAVDSQTLGWPERFFPTLWQVTEEDASVVRNRWRTDLVQRAREVLDDAGHRLPLPSNRSYRSQVRARGYLEGVLRKKGLVQASIHHDQQEELA